MTKKIFGVIINFIVLSCIILIFTAQISYAEEIQKSYNYDLELDFKQDYGYQSSEYNFLAQENVLVFNSFIGNTAFINQNGNYNQSSISQIGILGSIVEVIQIGNDNRASVKQFANSTKAEVFQFGSNHDLSIEQWGSEGQIYIIQSGDNLENKEIQIIQF